MKAILEFFLFCGLIFAWSGLVTLLAFRLKAIQASPKTIDAPSIST